MPETSYEALRKVQLHEKNYAALSPLEDDFYGRYRVLLLQLRERLRASFSIDAASALEGTQRMLADVVRRREQKIFLKALRDFHAGTVDSTGLAAEEKEVYNSVTRMLGEYEERQVGGLASSPAAAKDEKPAFVSLTFLVDLPAFVGISGTIGPFSANQKASLSRDDARLLVDQGVAQEA